MSDKVGKIASERFLWRSSLREQTKLIPRTWWHFLSLAGTPRPRCTGAQRQCRVVRAPHLQPRRRVVLRNGHLTSVNAVLGLSLAPLRPPPRLLPLLPFSTSWLGPSYCRRRTAKIAPHGAPLADRRTATIPGGAASSGGSMQRRPARRVGSAMHCFGAAETGVCRAERRQARGTCAQNLAHTRHPRSDLRCDARQKEACSGVTLELAAWHDAPILSEGKAFSGRERTTVPDKQPHTRVSNAQAARAAGSARPAKSEGFGQKP